MKRNPPPPPSQPQPPPPEPSPAASSVAAEPLPDDLARLAVEGEQLENPQPPPAPEPERGAEKEVPTAAFLAGMMRPAFDQLAPNWKVKESEVAMLAVGWAAVLDHYFPGGVSSWGPWGVALGATVAVIGPRINTPPRLEEKPAESPAGA